MGAKSLGRSLIVLNLAEARRSRSSVTTPRAFRPLRLPEPGSEGSKRFRRGQDGRAEALRSRRPSPFSQACDDGPCSGEVFFVKRRTWRIAATAHCFYRLIDLAERGSRHGGVLPPLGKEH